jgi:membrane-associated protease RseP (regulator of RpoE activity)
VNHWFRSPIAVTVLTLVVVGAALAGYFFRGGETPNPSIQNSSSSDNTPNTVDSLPSVGATDMEKRIKDLTGMLGGAIPATSIAKGFYVPGLGVRIAYLTPEQSASMLGAIPPGAVVMEVESGRPMARAGLQVGDLVLSIGGKKIAGENDLRQAIFKIGPGKTEYSYQRGGDTKTLMIDCPSCKVE